MANPYILDPFQTITNVQFGGTAYLLLTVEIAGGNNTSSPPPFGTFAYSLPKGAKLLATKVITRKQSGGSTPSIFYFPWNTIVLPPDNTNWTTIAPWGAGNPLFQWSVIDTNRGFPTDPAFPAPDKQFWYSTAAKAAAAAAIIPTISNNFYMATFADFLTHTFSGSSLGPPVLEYGVQSITVQEVGSSVDYVVQYLFQVPSAHTTLPFTFQGPSSCSGDGWASIFTKQTNVQGIFSLRGNADQSLYFPATGAGNTTYNIVTVGKPGQGTVSVSGASPFSPGLPPNAPPQPSH
jgi:hypothetical protein